MKSSIVIVYKLILHEIEKDHDDNTVVTNNKNNNEYDGYIKKRNIIDKTAETTDVLCDEYKNKKEENETRCIIY